MFIVILQPVETDSQPVRFHVPETSTGGLGDVGVDEHADSTNAMTTTLPARRMGLMSPVLIGFVGLVVETLRKQLHHTH